MLLLVAFLQNTAVVVFSGPDVSVVVRQPKAKHSLRRAPHEEIQGLAASLLLFYPEHFLTAWISTPGLGSLVHFCQLPA